MSTRRRCAYLDGAPIRDRHPLPSEVARVPVAAVGLCVTLVAIAAMAVDHLLGDDPGLEDPVTFAIRGLPYIAQAARKL